MATLRKRDDISTLTETRYQVAVVRDGITLQILGYTARKSKIGILYFLTEDLSHHFTETELDSKHTYTAKDGLVFGDGSIRIGFTGETERQNAV